jgi:hypothetical protein
MICIICFLFIMKVICGFILCSELLPVSATLPCYSQ